MQDVFLCFTQLEQRDGTHRIEAEIQVELFERTRDRSIYMEQYQRYADKETAITPECKYRKPWDAQ